MGDGKDYDYESMFPKSLLKKLAEYSEADKSSSTDGLADIMASRQKLTRSFDGETLGGEIKRRRKLQKLSEVALADLAGVSRSTVQKIESANLNVTVESILSVMKAVGMELTWR